MQPLQGITVVALEQAVAAPFATRQLADLGARVIKVERPGSGDFARGYDQRVRGLSSHFVWANRSKESLTLDLKQPAAAEVLLRLIHTRADVLVQNLAPGAAARLGLSYDALSAARPGLIVCDISGYGDDALRPGPYRDKKAYDLLIQSEAGLLSVTGTPDAPAKVGASVADIAAGMYALQRHPGRAAAAPARWPGAAGRGVDAGIAGRVDGVPDVLRLRRRRTAAAQRCQPRHDLPLRPLCHRRRQDRDARPAERARMGGLLRAGAAAAGVGERPALSRQRRAQRPARGPAWR